MTSFINDPEAQRRYRERFGAPTPANEESLFIDPAVQAAYEASGFRETPSVRFGTQQTWEEIRAAPRPATAPSFPEGAVFSEPSARLSRLAARARGGGDFNTSGNDPFLAK